MSLLLRNRVNVLICDMAGTTINEGGIIYKSLYNTLKNLGFPATDEEQKSWHGRDKKEVIEDHIKKYIKTKQKKSSFVGITSSETKSITEYTKIAEVNLLKNLRMEYFSSNKVELMDPGLTTLFTNLRFNGIQIALNTGYPKDFQREILEHFVMTNVIDTYISSEEVAMGRPYPYMIHNIMETLCIPNSKNVAKIGDTPNDMMEGKNAGCGLVIGVLSGDSTESELRNYGADVVLNNIMDLNDNILDDHPFLL